MIVVSYQVVELIERNFWGNNPIYGNLKLMKKKILLLSIFIFILGGSTLQSGQAQSTQEPSSLQEIDLGVPVSLIEWYENQSGLIGNETFFGAYITLPVDEKLYIGLGSARPAEDSGDGAYFAYFDGTQISGIGHLDEQGVHEMIWDGTIVHIAGTDPHNVITGGNDWSTGNHYNYDPGTQTLSKYRDPINGLLYAFHTWGLWKEGPTLFAAASVHDGSLINGGDCIELDDNGDPIANHCMGKIFITNDNGATWTAKSPLGGYRAYDIIGFNAALYAIANNEYTGPLTLYKSVDGGTTWVAFPSLTNILRMSHLTMFDGSLIATSFDRAHLLQIDKNDQIIIHNLPTGYLLGTDYADRFWYSDYHMMVSVGGMFYVLVEEQTTHQNAILSTQDFSNWQIVASTDEKLISLSYWPANNWLVTSSPGINAKLWKIDLPVIQTFLYFPFIAKTYTP